MREIKTEREIKGEIARGIKEKSKINQEEKQYTWREKVRVIEKAREVERRWGKWRVKARNIDRNKERKRNREMEKVREIARERQRNKEKVNK